MEGVVGEVLSPLGEAQLGLLLVPDVIWEGGLLWCSLRDRYCPWCSNRVSTSLAQQQQGSGASKLYAEIFNRLLSHVEIFNRLFIDLN